MNGIGIVPNIISQLDNSASLLPIFTKDLINNCGRTAMAYKESGVHEARERFIEESATGLLWVGGIPLFRKIFDKAIFNPMFKKHNFGADASKIDLRTLPNFHKVLKLSTKASKQLTDNAQILKFQNKIIATNVAKTLIATLIPLYLLVKVLPKFNQGLTKKLVLEEHQEKASARNDKRLSYYLDDKNAITFASFIKPKSVSFQGLGSGLRKWFNPILAAQTAQINPVDNMIFLDMGISGGRVYNSRNKEERAEVTFRESGIIFFMFFASSLIAKGLNKFAEKVFKTPIELDAKILGNNSFIDKIKKALTSKETTKGFLNFANINTDDNALNTEEKILKFIDSELANKNAVTEISKKKVKLANPTLEIANKLGLIDIIKKDDKYVRNPVKFIKTDDIVTINKRLSHFVNAAENNKDNIEKFVKNSFKVKSGMVIANLAICSFALGYLLPKIQYKLRVALTGSNEFPGTKQYKQEAKAKFSQPQINA